jgi:hypothetical protein
VRSQDRVGNDASAGLALYQSHTTYPVWAATRGAGARGRTESALGLGHHEHPSVGADRMVLASRFAMRITAEDLAEMLREAIFRRFGETRAHAQGIEFLSDNGPEYTSHRFRSFVRAMGLIPCHTPRRSPQSNGLAEAFFGSFKRDYEYQACLDTLKAVQRQVPTWIDHYNQEAPHSALRMQSPVEFYAAWLFKNKTRPVPI